MAHFGQKKKITEYLYSKPSIAVLIILACFLSVTVFQRFVVERDMAARKDAVEEDRELLMNRRGELKERVEYLSGDRGIEEEIRKHFDVAKDGEQVVIIVDKTEVKREESKPQSPTPKPWYQFW
jgi:cell division protein FtsB